MANVIEVIIRGNDEASKVIAGIGASITNFGVVAAAGAAVAGAAFVGVGVAIGKMTLDAAAVEGTRKTFKSLAEDIDSTAEALTTDLRRATRGMVEDADLWAASNKFVAMSITETAEETAEMAEMATQLGMAMGEKATPSMENFALMMANQSIPRLDSFGISSSRVRERMKELTKAVGASGISQEKYDKKIVKSTKRITKLKNQLHLMGIKQSEWTEKTKESTKIAHKQRIDEITWQLEQEEIALREVKNMTVGVTGAVEAMTREEAFKIAVLEEGRIAMKRVGEQGDTYGAVIDRIRASIANTTRGIGEAFLPTLGLLGGVIEDLADKYGPKLIAWAELAGEWLEEKLPLAIAWLGEKWNEWWPRILGVVIAAWTFIRPIFEVIRDWLKIAVPAALALLGDLWDTWWPKIATAVVDAWAVILPVITDLRELVQELLLGAIEVLGEKWNEIWPGMAESATNAEAEMDPLWEKMVQGPDDSVESLSGLQKVWQTTLAVIQASAEAVTSAVLPILMATLASLGEALAVFGLDWGDVWDAIKTATKIVAITIGVILIGLVAIFTGMVTAIARGVEHIVEVLGNLARNFMLGLTSIIQIIVGAWTIIYGIFTGNMDIIKMGWDLWLEGLWGTVQSVFWGIANLFDLILGTILAAVGGFVEGVWNFFVGLFERLIGHSLIRDKMNAIADTILGKLEHVIGTIFTFRDRLVSAGRAIMDGLRSGVVNGMAAVRDAIIHAVQDAIAAAKAALGIWSPSRVFEGFGDMTMQGLAKGIKNSARLAEEEAKRVLAGGGLAFGGLTLTGAATGGGGGVTTVSIVNYFGVDSVRTDEDILDIADAISQELELRGIGPVL